MNALWLEPSHGKGVFVQAISSLGVPRKRIVAIDIDGCFSPLDELADVRRGIDFLEWATKTTLRFNRIVGNPPYVAISRLSERLRQSALSVVDLNDATIPASANLWYAFVLASIRLLSIGGSLAFVLPSAAEFADYSAHIRNNITEQFARLDLFRCARPLFENVQEGTLVALARGFRGGPGLVRRRSFPSRQALIEGLRISHDLPGHKCPSKLRPLCSKTVQLQSVARISIGGVTGDASFFLMNDSRREQLELPIAAVRRVVSKAKHLRSAMLDDEEWASLKKNDERVWLFHPSPALLKHPAVRRYMRLGSDKGGCHRDALKIRFRRPWYRTPMPPKPDAFLSGMSQMTPWICINGTRNVTATNTLYVIRFQTRNTEEWYKWCLAMLSSKAWNQIRRIGRRYPDGLLKWEPGNLGTVELPNSSIERNFKSLYRQAIDALYAKDLRLARDIADSALLP